MTSESTLRHLVRSLLKEASEPTVPLVLDRFSRDVLYHNEIAHFENIPGFSDEPHLRFYADWERGRRHYSGYRFPASRDSLEYLTRSAIDNALDIIIHNQLDDPRNYPDAKRQIASLRRLDSTVKDLLSRMPA
jgi:hypothetical protein